MPTKALQTRWTITKLILQHGPVWTCTGSYLRACMAASGPKSGPSWIGPQTQRTPNWSEMKKRNKKLENIKYCWTNLVYRLFWDRFLAPRKQLRPLRRSFFGYFFPPESLRKSSIAKNHQKTVFFRIWRISGTRLLDSPLHLRDLAELPRIIGNQFT